MAGSEQSQKIKNDVKSAVVVPESFEKSPGRIVSRSYQ